MSKIEDDRNLFKEVGLIVGCRKNSDEIQSRYV